MVTPGEQLIADAVNSLLIEVGTVTSAGIATGNSLPDATKHWAVNIHVNRIVKIIRGVGAGQTALIVANVRDSLIIRGTWLIPIGAGATYIIYDEDIAQSLRDVLGGGANITAANPLPVDMTTGVEVATEILAGASLS